VVKIRKMYPLQTQYLMLTLTCIPKCSCDFKATSNITSRFMCM
jgi:hypothetical protein